MDINQIRNLCVYVFLFHLFKNSNSHILSSQSIQTKFISSNNRLAHVDHGKTTLCDHLIASTSSPPRTQDRYGTWTRTSRSNVEELP